MPTSITSSGITFDDATTQTTSATKAGGIGTAQLANAAVTPAKLSQPLTLATAQNTTSGTSIDFTGIPSWVKRITVTLAGVSTNGSSNLLLRLGTSSGVTSTSYRCSFAAISSSPAYANAFSDTGLLLCGMSSTSVVDGVFALANQTGNLWLITGTSVRVDGLAHITNFTSGGHTLPSTLDRIRLTTVNGADTFDAGSVNIMYEG